MINQILRDRYLIKSLLGRKTGRRTFLAEDLQTNSTVVIELLLFNPDFVWDDLKLFDREVAVLKSLDLEAIPQYLDSFDADTELGKGFALVQTYIDARSLQEWVESGRTFSESDIKSIAQELLQILDYLHHRQPPVIHRDLKPSNILLANRSGNSPGQVYLVDFGSVQTAQAGGTITVVGTYGYMPPEQFGGHTQPASDLYALGATLIYLATGSHPSELPQQEMRIGFVDALAQGLHQRVNLSSQTIDWLKWLTEPSLDLRLKSASAALEALSRSTLHSTDRLAIASKPFGSKILLHNTPAMLEILIPPRGFHLGLIFPIVFLIFWDFFCLSMLIATQTPFILLHLGAGMLLSWSILFTVFGKRRLRITPAEISLSSEIFGLKCYGASTAPRQYISQIEITHTSYAQDSKGNPVEVPPAINIWSGIKKFNLGSGDKFSMNFFTSSPNLSTPELLWLAQELSNWLNLPINK